MLATELLVWKPMFPLKKGLRRLSAPIGVFRGVAKCPVDHVVPVNISILVVNDLPHGNKAGNVAVVRHAASARRGRVQ